MKISQEQKLKNRDALLAAAVDVISQEGYKQATMRQIAREAQLSDAVIYNYFPTKESLLYGYFERTLDKTIQQLKNMETFETLPLPDQLQLLVETQLEQFEGNEEFVKSAFDSIFVSSLSNAKTKLAGQRSQFVEFCELLLDAAIEAEEIHNPPFKKWVAESLWDYQVGAMYYWIHDESENKVNTTQMVQKCVSLFTEILQSQILSKAADLLQFMFRQHVLGKLDGLAAIDPSQLLKKKGMFDRGDQH